MSEGKKTFRSAAWFGHHDKEGFIHRGWMRNQGLPSHVFDGRPVNGGYQQLYVQHGMLACDGADLDFLVGCRGTAVIRDSH